MEDLFVPTLHTFENNNLFTGSWGLLRFRIEPEIIMKTAKEIDMEASSIKGEFWHGKFSYEKSQMEGSQIFPLSQEGRNDLIAWLREHA